MKIQLLLLTIVVATAVLRHPHENPDSITTLASAACLTLSITGEVESIRKSGTKLRIIVLAKEAKIIKLGRKPVQGRLLLLSGRITGLHRGCSVRIHGESVPLDNHRNPDLPEAAVFRPSSIILLPIRSPLKRLLKTIRHTGSQFFNRAGRTIAPFLHAFFLGDRSGIPTKKMTIFRKTGLAHCLAVSGFHVGLLALLLGHILSFLPRIPRLLLILPALIIFTLTTGARPATVRAATVFSAAALLPDRHPGGILCLCAAGMLIATPQLLFSLSAQLSFTACIGILTLTRPLLRQLRRLHLPVFLAGPCAVSLAAQIALLPILAGAFGRISLIAPLTNAILLPLFLLCCLGAPLAILLQIITGWTLPGNGVLALFHIFEEGARTAASIPGAVLHTGNWTTAHTLLWYAGLLLLSLLCRQIRKWRQLRLSLCLRKTVQDKNCCGRGATIVSLPDRADGGAVERDTGSNRRNTLPEETAGLPETERAPGPARTGTEFPGQPEHS